MGDVSSQPPYKNDTKGGSMAITHMNLSFTQRDIKQFWKKMGKEEKKSQNFLIKRVSL